MERTDWIDTEDDDEEDLARQAAELAGDCMRDED